MGIRTELTLRLPNSPGSLGGLCRALADERVNIVALALEATGHLRLVVDNHVRAVSVLKGRHYQISEKNVVVVALANGPGTLAPVLTLAAQAGVNINYAYASTADGNATASVVLGVDDAQRAAAAAGL
jgi:hypothetical protein